MMMLTSSFTQNSISKDMRKVEGNAGSFFMNPVVTRKRYEKLARKNLVEILEVDDLPYDVVLTDYGSEILSEIRLLEKDWVEIADFDVEELRKVALNTFEISYKFKKSQKYQF